MVLGLRGGVDSAVCARLARDALGADSVLCVSLPAGGADGKEVDSAADYARALGVRWRRIDLAPIVAALKSSVPELSDPTDVGNALARCRMTVLYALARQGGARVLGTGNKSELLLGYFRMYGVGGVDMLPFGDLYMTEVWELAERLGVPEPIRTRAPTAGFWPGQTDEGEIGLPYRDVDRILRGLEELRPIAEIAELTGQPTEVVLRVEARVRAFRHKRRLPPVPKLSLRTIGIDWSD